MNAQALSAIPEVSDADIALLVAALADDGRRVQRLELSRRTVWIKRYGTEPAIVWQHLHRLIMPVLPPVFRSGPRLGAEAMITQEVARMARFTDKGFRVPQVLYRSGAAVVLSDLSPSIDALLSTSRGQAEEHDALLVACAGALGLLHAAGLCHGRPYPRDMTLTDGEVGFLDFEENPEAVMPLADAQARDLWVLFFQISSRALKGRETFDAAFAAWASHAPQETQAALSRLIGFAARFLPLARLIGRVRMGSDLRRFIVATGYLVEAVGSDKRNGRQGRIK